MSGEDATDREVRDVVAQVARELDARLPEATAELAALFLEEIPAFRGDDGVRELMAASTSSNLSTIFDVLLHGLSLEQISVPAAAAAYARRFAQRELPIESLLRAYRLGQGRVIQWSLRLLGARELTPEVLLGAAQEISSVVSRYIDQISEHLVQLYETERKLWTQRTDAARAVALRTVLHDDALDASTAEAMIGYRLHGWHLAAVAWADPATPEGRHHVESCANVIASVDGRRPLVVLDDEHTLWAWLSGPERPVLDEPALTRLLSGAPELRVALGEPARGLPGFRASHQEAQRARAVAEAAGEQDNRITHFAQVGIAALLSENVDALQAWVARTLGALANDDEATDRLRETVRVFLAAGGSFTDAAARLHLHKNTVHYRVRKAEEVRGRPVREDRLDVEVALVACKQLGQRVLRRPT
jgi:DNA-binding PucR family transcriptional regulator